MGVRLLHLADLHLGSQHAWLGPRADERAREVLESFRTAVNTALDPARRIDGLLVAGNLFERHRPDAETWSFVRGLLGRLVAAQKPVFIVPGTRDGIGYKDSIFRTERWPGVEIFNNAAPGAALTRTINGETLHVYASAFVPGYSAEIFPGFQRNEGTGFHVGLLHAAMPGHDEFETRPHDQIVDRETLARSGLDYVALGGFHAFTNVDSGTVPAVYPGTLEGRRFDTGDFGPKSLLVVDLEHGDDGRTIVRLETLPASKRTIEETVIDLDHERIVDAEGLRAALVARASRDVIARITLEGPLEFIADIEAIAAEVAEGFFHLEVVDRTDLLKSRLLRRLETEGTIRGIFVRRMLQRLIALEARAKTAGPEATVHRDLRVAHRALRLGLEQFLDEEAPAEAFPSIHGERAAETPPVSERAVAPTALRNGVITPPTRLQALLRSERAVAAGGLGELEEGAS